MNEQLDANNNGVIDAKGLLDMLRGQGLDDEAIEVLLSNTIQEIHVGGEQMPAGHDEKEKAGELLGVEL